MSENFSWFDPHSSMKVDGDGFESQLSGLDAGSQTVSNPSITLAGPRAANYQTHSTPQQHMPMPIQADYPGHDTSQTSETELAAEQLFSLRMVSQNQSSQQALHFNGFGTAGSWGNIGASHPMVGSHEAVKSPMISSGRQSSKSYHGAPQNLSFDQQQFQSPVSQQQQLPNMWNSQQQVQSTPRAYQQPLQIDTSGYNFFQNPQMRGPQSAQPRAQNMQRPTMMHFGSDSNFGNRYRPPNGYMPQEDEKAANLNNVPFAAQVAAHGQSHAQALTPEAHQRYSRHSVPNSATNFHSTLSSPTAYGGLPLTSPIPAAHRHSHPFHQMARHSIEDSKQDDDDAEFEDSQPRKRRKSQLQREDDEEYTPYGHVKAPNPKRGPKAAPKAGDISDDDDDDEYIVTPSNNKTSTKRRKSTAKARASPDSEDWASPTAVHSDSAEPTSSSKKKGRNSQARNNLTEEEKRMNHIRSEKTRRDLIKIQYDTLDDLVPALKGGKSGLSRADILLEIVTYVENTVAGNKTMTNRLSSVSSGGAGASNGVIG